MPFSNPRRRPRPAFHPSFRTLPTRSAPLSAHHQICTATAQTGTKVTVRLPRPLGVSLAETKLETGDAQVVVSAVHPQGAAAGLLHVGDIVVGLADDTDVRCLETVVSAIRDGTDAVTLVLQRNTSNTNNKKGKQSGAGSDGEDLNQLIARYNRGGRQDADLVELLQSASDIVKQYAVNARGEMKINDVVYRLRRANIHFDLRFYNVVMWSFIRVGAAQKAIELFEEIEKPNVECYTTLIKACSILKRTEQALGLIGRMRKEGVKPNVRTYNALIAACVRGGHLERARALFSEMLVDEVRPNVVSWNILILWHVTQKRGERRVRDALKAFRDMQASGISPNVVTYTTIMKMYASSGMFEKAEEVFADMKMRLVGQLDTNVYNVLLNAYAKKLDWRRCIDLLDEMKENVEAHNNKPWLGEDVFEYGGARTLKGLDDVDERRYKPDAVSYSLVVKACAGAGRPLIAQQVFDEMMAVGLNPPPTQAVVSLLAGYANCSMLTESFQVLKQLKSWGVAPEERILSSLMHACLTVNQPKLALSVYAKLKSAKFDTDVVTYTLLLKAYGMCGELEKAFNVLKAMKREGGEVAPNVVTYNALIECCLLVSKRDMALKALDMLLSDDKVKVKVNRNTFHALTLCGGNGNDILSSLGEPVFDMWAEEQQSNETTEEESLEEAEAHMQYLMDVLRRIREAGVVPNGTLYRALLEACESVKEWHLGDSLVQERRNGGFMVGRKDAEYVRVLEDLFRARLTVEPLT